MHAHTTTEPAAVPAITARGVTKVYGTGETTVHALGGVDVDFGRERFTAIMGPSGSGKSTLMHCLAGLDTVSVGRFSWATPKSRNSATRSSPNCDASGSDSSSKRSTCYRCSLLGRTCCCR